MDAALHLKPAAINLLGLVSGPLPAAISVASLVLLLAYRIDRAAQTKIVAQLAERRSAAK
jgi:Na+/melibiose symporter-like transporter